MCNSESKYFLTLKAKYLLKKYVFRIRSAVKHFVKEMSAFVSVIQIVPFEGFVFSSFVET